MNLLYIIILTITITYNNGLDFSTDTLKCKDDENFEACAIPKTKIIIPELAKGDPHLNVPSLLPLKLSFLQLLNSPTLELNLTDVEIYGLEKAEVIKLFHNGKDKTCGVTIHLTKAKIVGIYHVEGRILSIPIRGNGKGELAIVNGIYDWNTHYKLEKRNGKVYAHMYDAHVEYTVEKAETKLDKLFGSDDVGKQMNAFLNENWKEIEKEFHPAVAETIRVVITRIGNAVVSTVPWDDVFIH